MKDKLVIDNSKLIYKIAAKFYGVPKDDLYQAGMLGLLNAYRQYNPECGAKFSTFAYKYIFGEMYLLANKKAIKVNRDTLKMYKYIEKNRYLYAQELGHVPSNSELSSILNIELETIDYVCASSGDILSMDSEYDDERNLYDTICSSDGISFEDRISLYDSLKKLPKEERKVLIDRYFKDETQQDIANNLNTSQVRISRLEKKGLSRMKKFMEVS